jgi:hypothetical protein
MLLIAMATLKVSNNDTFDIVVWIGDLNSIGPEKGGLLKQGKTLSVQLQEDDYNNVYYHWAAEQLVVGPAYHGAGDIGPAPVAPLKINLEADDNVLPFMFRPYP